eukprot:1032437-Amphidinium_carterae.1
MASSASLDLYLDRWACRVPNSLQHAETRSEVDGSEHYFSEVETSAISQTASRTIRTYVKRLKNSSRIVSIGSIAVIIPLGSNSSIDWSICLSTSLSSTYHNSNNKFGSSRAYALNEQGRGAVLRSSLGAWDLFVNHVNSGHALLTCSTHTRCPADQNEARTIGKNNCMSSGKAEASHSGFSDFRPALEVQCL